MVRQGPRLSSVEVLTILSRACPELAVALSPFGYAQGKLCRRDGRMGQRKELRLARLEITSHSGLSGFRRRFLTGLTRFLVLGAS